MKIEQTLSEAVFETQQPAALTGHARSFINLKAFASDANQGRPWGPLKDDCFQMSRRIVDFPPALMPAGVITPPITPAGK